MKQPTTLKHSLQIISFVVITSFCNLALAADNGDTACKKIIKEKLGAQLHQLNLLQTLPSNGSNRNEYMYLAMTRTNQGMIDSMQIACLADPSTGKVYSLQKR